MMTRIRFRYSLGLLLFIPIFLMGQSSIHFAVIGDFGNDSEAERDVANLVKSWRPEFIITVGDNNCPSGADSTIDRNIGKYYHEFIAPYSGTYGKGSSENKFFPSLGNHDWRAAGAAPHLKYFTLPGNKRYYDIVRGPVHLFAIDSDPHEPDSTSATSVQALWLKQKLAVSTSRWNVVYFHHPPFTSGIKDGPTPNMAWPFKSWGASAVLSGHEHNYERMMIDSMLYIVDGAGGRPLYQLGKPIPGSIVRFDKDHGALKVDADDEHMTFQFITREGEIIDTYTMTAPATTK